MATSSFSKSFVISNPKAVEQLVHSIENPTTIKLEKRDLAKETERKKAILCNLDKRLASMNL